MSVQTGVETPRGPASRRIGDRVKYRMDLLRAQPNPLWMREMRQSARLLRTPIILMVLAVLTTMLMASLGGMMTGSQSPAEVGTILFHTYFSLAWFVVTLVGPALAANSIASEREGHTWEAVMLTGLRPAEVARGKFMSAYTAIAMFIVMLAPVGALPFLFGGVTPIEVLVAFVFLFLIALLSVAFGLAISSNMESLRGALLVTLLGAIPLSVFAFSFFGVAMSAGAHELWDAVESGPPVWLPTAYSRAPFGVEYVVYLILLPLAAISVPAWLLYEVTRSNLTSVTDDRSHGLKRWLMVTSFVLAAAATVPMFAVRSRDRADALIIGMSIYVVFIVFCALLFGGEPIGPSRRVKQLLEEAGALRRFIAPGVVKAAQLQLVCALLALAALCAVGVVFINTVAGARATQQTEQVVVFAAYAIGFSCFVIGLAAWLRSRATSSAVPRVLLIVTLFFISTGPWILAAITGVIGAGSSNNSSLVVAAPSPFYVFVALAALARPDPGIAVVASMTAAVSYAVLGLLLLLIARGKCKRIIDEHEKVLREADRRLAEEDRQAADKREADQHAADQALEAPAADASAPDTDPSPTADDDAAGAAIDGELAIGHTSDEADADAQPEEEPDAEPESKD